jgi:WD40 repeat protein
MNELSENEEYLLHLPSHLSKGCLEDELFSLLVDFEFLDFKIAAADPQAIIEDFDLGIQINDEVTEYKRITLGLISDAIRLSANILGGNLKQLAEQLWGRLQEIDIQAIQELLTAAKQSKKYPWLRPLKSSLTSPVGNLVRTFTGHKDCVEHIALTLDGKFVISAARNKEIRIWDIEKGREEFTLQGFAVDCLAAIDTNRFVVAGASGKSIDAGSPDSIIKIIIMRFNGNYEEVAIAELEQSVCSLIVTADQKILIAGMKDGKIQIWDLNLKKLIWVLSAHEAEVKSVAISSNSNILAATCYSAVKVWDFNTKEEVWTFFADEHSIRKIVITPDEKKLISASDDETLKVWDLVSHKEILTLSGHTSVVTSVAVAPDGQRAVSTSADDRVKIWSLEDGSETLTLSGHSGWVADVAITPDGRQIVSCSWDNTVKIWNLRASEAEQVNTSHSSAVNSLLTSSDRRQIISASKEDGVIKVWNISGEEVLSFFTQKYFVSGIALFPDNQRLLSSAGTIMKHGSWGKSDNSLKVWDIDSGTELLTMAGHDSEIRCIAISPDGEKVVSGSRDNSVRLWDVTSGQEMLRLTNHTEMINAVIFTPDGKRCISASGDKTLRVWDLSNGEEIYTLFEDDWQNGWVNYVGVIPNSRKIISSHNHNHEILKVWDFDTGQKLLTLIGECDSISSLLVAEDGKKAISGSRDGKISIWNLLDGCKEIILSAHSSEIYSMALFQNNEKLVTAAGDNHIKIWNLVEGNMIASFIAESPIGTITVLPDEMLIIAGDWVGNVHFLRLEESNSF